MSSQETTLAMELLINHVLHLRSQVEILQEQLHQAQVVSQEKIERAVEENWSRHGEEVVEAFWKEVTRLHDTGP